MINTKEICVLEALAKMYPIEFGQEKNFIPEYSLDTTFIEFANLLNWEQSFNKEYEQKKQIAPFWGLALEKWIEEIEDNIVYCEHYTLDYDNVSSYMLDKSSIIRICYNDIIAGKNSTLKDIVYLFTEYYDDGNYNPYYAPKPHLFKYIAKGVEYAYKLVDLKHELLSLNLNIENEKKDIPTPSQKLKWTGTASQFGHIIQQLIENGYLEKPTKHFTKDVKIYMALFEIETTIDNLENEINIYKNSLVQQNKKQIVIPHINKLSSK